MIRRLRSQGVLRRMTMRGALLRGALLAGISWMAAAGSADAQQTNPETLEDLVSEMREVNPEVQAAYRVADAAEARIPQAGALADPVLLMGFMNVPVPSFDPGREGMTMFSVQVGQRLPAPGTRSAREAIAGESHRAATWDAEEIALASLIRLKSAYYESLFIDKAREILTRNRALLVDVAEVAEARFAVGRAPQQDVLRAQTEITRLDEQLAGLHARRDAAVAEINAILQRPVSRPLVAAYPENVRALALAAPTESAFTAAALEGGLGDAFSSLDELQRLAVEERPMVQAHLHRIEAARQEVHLAERERLPDVDVMLGYGVRSGRADMVSASVSVPLPVFAGRKQRQVVAEAGHELAAAELRHHQMVAEIEAEVASRYATLVRTREQILLLGDGVIPQAQATVESAAAAYQAGRVEFMSLLDAQASLFRNEIELVRRLSDFGREWAELERAVGMELSTENPR